jgi:hypothetical protein
MNAPRARLGAYAWWQLRDYASGPGLGTLVITLLVGVAPIIAVMRAVATGTGGEPPDELIRPLFNSFVQFLALVGPIMAVGSMVSADRAPGLTRFLFAKPVGAPQYYLLMWSVRGAGLLAITAVLSLAIHLLVAPVAWGGAVLGIALTWLHIGGVGFLASVLVPRDSVYVIGLYATTTLLAQFQRIAPQWEWVDPLLVVLPPMHKLSDLRVALMDGTAPAWNDLWHVMGWGGACLTLGAVLIRRFPLVR